MPKLIKSCRADEEEYIFLQQQYVYDIAGNVQDTVKISYCIYDKLCILYWGSYCGI
jgi:hypothetical protein